MITFQNWIDIMSTHSHSENWSHAYPVPFSRRVISLFSNTNNTRYNKIFEFKTQYKTNNDGKTTVLNSWLTYKEIKRHRKDATQCKQTLFINIDIFHDLVILSLVTVSCTLTTKSTAQISYVVNLIVLTQVSYHYTSVWSYSVVFYWD